MDAEAFNIVAFLKGIWPQIVATLTALAGAIGWAWDKNEKTHKDLYDLHDKQTEAIQELKEQQSTGYSKLNDKIMEHIDARIGDVYTVMRAEDSKLQAAILRIGDTLDKHSQRSEDRHLELMRALHAGLERKADK